MLFKIKSNPMHPLSCTLPLPYVPARVTRGALVAHRHIIPSPSLPVSSSRPSKAPTLCRPSTTGGLLTIAEPFCPLSVSLWNDLSNPVLDGVGLEGFKCRANAFLLA